MTTINLYNNHLHEENAIETAGFYNEATEDYKFWSHDFNMHFGYYSLWRTNPFRRDSMLNEMNRQIYNRLGNTMHLCDLGCGMGGTMRYGLKNSRTVKITGITLSEFQAIEGNKLFEGYNGQITIGNYNQTGFADNAFDGAIAIESFCHSGHARESFTEAYRILKPGAKLVVGDAFLKKELSELCIGGSYCYKGLCDGWSLEKLGNIPAIKKMLAGIGFSEVKIEEVSLRVGPSVLHVPFAITGFMIRKLIKRQKLKPESLKNLKGSLFALLSGVQMNNFGYYIITCAK
jgi:MPBQ/MSBQ methyltransferase